MAIPAGLAAVGVLLYDRVPVAWQWYLRNFWWNQELRSDTGCSWLCLGNGKVLMVVWAVMTAVLWLAAAALVLVVVAVATDWLVSKLRSRV